MWIAQEAVNLPYHNDGAGLRKEPGDKISKAEMEEAQQTPESIAALIKSGSIKEA